MTKLTCNICGENNFSFPKFRETNKNHYSSPPYCSNCGSLERHRIIKKVYDSNKKNSQTPLLFSIDPAKNYLPKNTEISLYEKKNSIDLLQIDRENESYDLIFCHHILEHIEDDKKGFSELCRILKKNGQIYWTVPSPLSLKTTMHDKPENNKEKHYRWYGQDFLKTVRKWSKEFNVKTKQIIEIDDITNFKDIVFVTEKT